MPSDEIIKQIKEKLISEFPSELLSLALVYAENFQLYGYDITNKCITATQNLDLINRVRAKEHAEVMEHLYDGLDQKKLSECITVLRHEKECVIRNIKGCDRDCANCDLVLPDQQILDAYDHAIGLLTIMTR